MINALFMVLDTHPRLPKPDSFKTANTKKSDSPQHRKGWVGAIWSRLKFLFRHMYTVDKEQVAHLFCAGTTLNFIQ